MSQVVDLGYRPHQWQTDAHAKLRRFSVVVAHRRFGKTYMAVRTVMHAALKTQKEAARFGYCAPFLKQAKGVAWDYLRRFSAIVPGTRINEQELTVTYPNDARIRLFGADNAEAMRGLYFDGIVPDEMADFRPHVWPTIIRPALSDRRGWAMFIGTPKGVNQFAELYQYAISGQDDEWAGLIYPVSLTGLIDERELASSRAIMSEAQYRQEWECDFSAASDNTLITIDTVSAAMRRETNPGEVAESPRILGVDVARFGDDRSVIQKRQGLVAFKPIVFQGLDNMELAGRVASEIAEWKPDAVFIDAGRGEGVIDRLRQLGNSVVEVNFGGRASVPQYANKRSEMWDLLAKWLTDGGNLPDDQALRMDLCAPTYSFDAQGRMVLEPKDAIKARGLRSTDVGDALALTFAYPVAMRSWQGYPLPPRSMAVDYDPFNS